MDLTNITLAGLVTIGVVNVIGFYKPSLDSKIKFMIALVVALLVSFVPVDVGNMFLDKLKFAIEIAFASSGAYKLVTKAGGQ